MGPGTFGAEWDGAGVDFRVWAPRARAVDVVLEAGAAHAMTRDADGVFHARVAGVKPGARYSMRMDGGPLFPDPASRFQPDGVHGPSQVVDPAAFRWSDATWRGVARERLVIYELHVGTFSPEGTYDGACARLGELRELGITAIELMPLADFPGRWNWGYDPAAFFAPSRAYGDPDALKRLVDHAHALGIAVLLDVVYNHFGPAGAYAPAFSPLFFTKKHATPWGDAINLDDEGSPQVRAFFLQAATQWLTEFHLDGLRLDATFALVDGSPVHFLAELTAAVAALPGNPRHLIAEDHRNLRTLLLPRDAAAPGERGYGLDGVWVDDFHHVARRILAGDSEGYYADYRPRAADLAKTLADGWLFQGEHSAHANAPRGTSPRGLARDRFVIFLQNHDQIGNRPQGDRLEATAGDAAIRAATAVLLFAPQIPLLFQGQEWAASAPFLYFTDHEPELGKRVTEGRQAEFGAFAGFKGAVPDPQAEETFRRSKLDWTERERDPHARRLALTRDLLALRKTLHGAFAAESPVEGAVVLRRGDHVLIAALADGLTVPLPTGIADARVVWQSEQPAYCLDPRSPRREGGSLHFPRAAAVVMAP